MSVGKTLRVKSPRRERETSRVPPSAVSPLRLERRGGWEAGRLCANAPKTGAGGGLHIHPEVPGTEPGGLPCPLQHESFMSTSKACRSQGARTLAWSGVSGEGRLSLCISWNSGTHLHIGTTLGSPASWSQAAPSPREGRRNRAWSSVDGVSGRSVGARWGEAVVTNSALGGPWRTAGAAGDCRLPAQGSAGHPCGWKPSSRLLMGFHRGGVGTLSFQ